MVRYKRVELEEGTPIQFLGIYATRWPYESGVEPTVGFVEDDEDGQNDLLDRLGRLEQAIDEARTLIDFVCTCEVDQADVAFANLKMWLRKNPESVKESNG